MITTSTFLRFSFGYQLLKSTVSDEGIANMLNTFDWFFLPVYNVDGYNFTMEVRNTTKITIKSDLSAC